MASEESGERANGPVRGLVLASGMSQRFGSANKLLEFLDGRTVLERTLEAYLSVLGECWVVVGHDAARVVSALKGKPVHIVSNADFSSGQSAALRTGIRALPPDTAAVLVGPGDQPLLEAEVLRRLIRRWRESPADSVVPTYSGRRGTPALICARLFDELGQVTGDGGGRDVVDRHAVEFEEMGELASGLDVDDPNDLREARNLISPEAV